MSGWTGHLDEARIHDLVDGELDRLEERAARAHVESCDACAERVRRIETLVDAVRTLPAEAAPSRDLWPDIESRIRGEAAVIPFPSSGDGEASGPSGGGSSASAPAGRSGGGEARRADARRVSVSIPLLWAAGIAVSLLSGSAVWLALTAGDARVVAGPEAPGPSVEVARVGAPDMAPIARTRPAGAAYEEATAELEAILEAGRDLLDDETLRTVEESLATIDRAIAEAEAALARDPASELLNRLILQHQRTRLRILRQAANGIPART